MRPTCAAAMSLALALALTASWSAAATPQLFKCIESGRTVYQQQACSVSSQIEPAASAPHASTKASEPATKVAARVKPATAPASSAPATSR